jgi:transposase-like protein
MNKAIQHTKINEAVNLLLEGDVDLSNVLGEGALVKELTKAILERALAAEMDAHLGYDRYGRSELNNSRNGSYNKNLVTDNGVIELNIPRDRESEFTPVIVPKKQTRIEGLD